MLKKEGPFEQSPSDIVVQPKEQSEDGRTKRFEMKCIRNKWHGVLALGEDLGENHTLIECEAKTHKRVK